MVSTTSLEQNEIQRLRILFLNGIVFYPAWGYLIQAFEPKAQDPIWIRFVLAGLLGVAILMSFAGSKKQKFLNWSLIIGSWAFLAHSSWVVFQAQGSYLLVCGHLLLIGSILNILPSRRSSLYYAFGSALLGFAVLFMEQPWAMHPVAFNVLLWSALIPALSANFTRIQKLNTLSGAQEEYQILFQNLKEGLIIHGPDRSIKGVNPAALNILGMTEKQVYEINPIHPKWQCYKENGTEFSEESHPLTVAFETKSEIRDVVMGVRKADGGTAWIKVTASPFQASPEMAEQSVLVTFSDIGEIKKSQKIIIEQQSRLEATAKLTALGDMAAGVAHEINNPLAIILGKVFLLRKAISTGKIENVEPALEKISSTVDRIQKIVKGLQTFASGGEQDPFETTPLKQLVEEALSFCQEKIESRSIKIMLDIDQDIQFDCRPVQISQALVNLIHNSCDAIEALETKWIKIWARSAHDQLVLTVTDSGTGIPPEVQKKLMQPFFTTKEVGKGTGLGLSISKGLIQSHMGRIWLNTSMPNTCFVIEMPLHQENQKKEKSAA